MTIRSRRALSWASCRAFLRSLRSLRARGCGGGGAFLVGAAALVVLLPACSSNPKPEPPPPDPCSGLPSCPTGNDGQVVPGACNCCHGGDVVTCGEPLPEPQCATFTDRGGTERVLGEACDCYHGETWVECEPEPDGPEFVDMLLRVKSPTEWQTIRGVPVKLQGAISCWPPEDPAPGQPEDWGGQSGWSVDIHPEWQDYAAEKFGANLFHARLGPAFSYFGMEGGPYVVEGGKADLARFDEAWWDTVASWVEYAGERGRYVEIDLIDGWQCKRGGWGDIQMQWQAASNMQGRDVVQECSARAIEPGDVFDAWVAQAVRKFGRFGNVLWQDGNEIGITGRYVPEWTLSLQSRVRAHEAALAFNVVHVFGTNSGRDDVRPFVDYVEEHQNHPLDGPLAGRPSMVNEANFPGDSGASPTTLNDYRCYAEANGTGWWYWRGGQSLEAMEATAALFRQPCGGGPVCVVPGADDPAWRPNPEQLPAALWTQYRAALERLGDRCGTSPDQTLAAVAAELVADGVCAGGPWGDAVIAQRPDGLWEEWHAVSYGNGCTIPATGAFKGVWKHDACPVPDSCGAKFSLSRHWSGAIDSTFTVTNCCDYCKSIGMGEYNGQPRCGCPVLPEGHAERPQRERDCIGVQRWWCDDVELAPCKAGGPDNCITPNPAQAFCSGRARTCTADLRFCSQGDF